MMSVPGAAGRKISFAFEDARAAHVQSEIADMIQDSIDNLDYGIEEIISVPNGVYFIISTGENVYCFFLIFSFHSSTYKTNF